MLHSAQPTPEAIDFTPGHLLGSVSGELGLRKYLEGEGHTFVVISDKDGKGCQFEKELVDVIHPRELVLHELNLLHDGYDFWAKIDDGGPEGPCWLPVHIEL